jgi:hypothetical protein
MNTSTINQINNKLKIIPDSFANDVLEYLEFLYFKTQKQASIDEYNLTNEQINILDERNKTPTKDCIPFEEFMTNLKAKYRV